MPHRREGAPGSFLAPLDELLQRLGGGPFSFDRKLHPVRQKQCRQYQLDATDPRDIFRLNEALYERSGR
jgi:hypothetical protein